MISGRNEHDARDRRVQSDGWRQHGHDARRRRVHHARFERADDAMVIRLIGLRVAITVKRPELGHCQDKQKQRQQPTGDTNVVNSAETMHTGNVHFCKPLAQRRLVASAQVRCDAGELIHRNQTAPP